MKDKIIGGAFAVILILGMVGEIFGSKQEFSLQERRRLMTKETLKENFTGNLDDYMTDQFPFRDKFLELSQIFNRYLLNNQEDNDVYTKYGYIIEKMYPLDGKSVDNLIYNLNLVKNTYLNNNNCYFSVIPDKSFFLDDNKYLKIDYEDLFLKLQNEIKMSYIDIKDELKLEDYYKTDIHLKQESYFKIIDNLARKLNFEIKNMDYKEIIFEDFKGSSYYKVPFKKKEELRIYTNGIIEKARVKHLEYKDNLVYQKDKYGSLDPYNVFLSGPSSLITITNESADTDRELVIFRDSFGSSLAPLLISYYREITLIDLRYINMKYVNNYVDFKNKDILFLYSMELINNSFILKF